MKSKKINPKVNFKKSKIDILYFASCGGHLVQILKIAKSLENYSCHFLVNDKTDLDEIMIGKTSFLSHAERDIFQIINIIEAIHFINKIRPSLFISTGSSPAVWLGLISRIFNIKVIYIDCLSKVKSPTLTGKLMYFIANKMYVQWPYLLKDFYPRAFFEGNLLGDSIDFNSLKKQKIIDNNINKKLDILYLSSCGGHLVQILEIAKHFKECNYHFIVNDRTDLNEIMIGKTSYLTHAERNILQIINIFEAIFYLVKFRPKVLISTGSSPAVWFGLIGRVMGVKILFIESISRILSPSLTGKLMYYIASKMYVQWPKLKKKFPKTFYKGNLLK
ncbi:UDP-N-acetylglucosamine transferase subunit ALG14 [Prochlorococcus sp. AH-716-A09]|nr:UDP-N-acetylglucosamine transferase subunit ALG14 [Prochlorococcus sp. AH-716-A09]